MFNKIKKKLNMTNKVRNYVTSSEIDRISSNFDSNISSINEDINFTNERLKNVAYDLDKLRGNLEIFKKSEAKDISGLNKKTELLFKQIDSTNRLIYSYVQEQLFNIEKVRLEMKRENLMHYIYEQIIDKQIYYILSIPWYKKITKKQRERINNNIKKIHDHTFELSKVQIEEVELEIKNHTREKFFPKLNNITKEIKNNQKGEYYDNYLRPFH